MFLWETLLSRARAQFDTWSSVVTPACASLYTQFINFLILQMIFFTRPYMKLMAIEFTDRARLRTLLDRSIYFIIYIRYIIEHRFGRREQVCERLFILGFFFFYYHAFVIMHLRSCLFVRSLSLFTRLVQSSSYVRLTYNASFFLIWFQTTSKK